MTTTDFRANPERYVIGRGEQGVLTVEPYKSELLPIWRFATPTAARASVKALWRKFVDYGAHDDFVGMDMARKFLQMGWTRSRRYANHPSGRKHAAGTRRILTAVEDAREGFRPESAMLADSNPASWTAFRHQWPPSSRDCRWAP